MANSLCDSNSILLGERINTAFASVSNSFEPLTSDDYFTISQETQPIPDRYIISVAQVEKSLSCINTQKAVGPDSIPNWLLQKDALSLAPPYLCHMEFQL